MFALILAALIQLPQGVHLIRGSFTAGTQPDGNSIVFDARDGLVVFDTGRHPQHTQKILDLARESRKPVAAIINSHWHLDHIGGNRAIRAAYPNVRIYETNALHDALGGFLANYRSQLEDIISKTSDESQRKAYQAEVSLIDAGPELSPTDVVTNSELVSIAGRKLQLNVDAKAVTASDIWVFDPKTRVVAAGDLVTLPAPFLDTACPSGWSAELRRIAKTNFKILIPGHGEPMSRADFVTYEHAFDALLACANTSSSSCTDDWMRSTRALQPKADETFTRSLMKYYVELLRDKQRIAKSCAH